MGSAGSEVLVQLNGWRLRKAFTSRERLVEQRHKGHRKARENWQVKMCLVCEVVVIVGAGRDKTVLVL